ncbi:murein hydrolase activator EnvC family protein [Anaerocolumna xylanovorans]|uniref:Murein DD-endopeptidase MepM and murein hydrolase activator NlpD, contain LysM domain n=1 Tax=Anaerocolumna xylanovorans DSM 12503 TaxID=1121345 RepID=A0A1M7Y7U1_9FIRM|nr:peptidoglycan DD-metalloendopeptidase family protein [Anaerocolumna xylanovorans]SHO48689.1 Murein DD-endopeptidase MepM and murein hydrolase activator NlpD, contain LysM domain [Anaerocolumna xylanovorans DSM 12503]
MKKKQSTMVQNHPFSMKEFLCKKGKLFAVFFLILVFATQSILSYAGEIEKAKEGKTTLEKKKEETESKIKELEKGKNDILNYIEKLDMELNDLTTEVEKLEGKIKKANSNLKVTKEELQTAKEKEKDQYSIMKSRIKYMYENGDTGVLEILLQSDNFSDMLNQMEYMEKITEYDNGLLEEYKHLKEEVTKKEKEQKAQLEELNSLKDEKTYEQGTIQNLVKQKGAEVVKYTSSIKESQALSEQYSQKIEDQEAAIEQLLEAERKRIEAEEKRKREEEERRRKEEEEKRKQEESQNSGTEETPEENNSSGVSAEGFIWPVPASSRITSGFGYRSQPTEGASTYHKGIDIGAPSGTKIVAAAGGTVAVAAYSVSCGNYIMIYHGNSTYTTYMHCSKLLVSKGDEVSQGQEIGLVGSTGISTGPHLHFAVTVNDEYKNPLNYVSY